MPTSPVKISADKRRALRLRQLQRAFEQRQAGATTTKATTSCHAAIAIGSALMRAHLR